METESTAETRWNELPIVCPHCGNHGEPKGSWTRNGWTPFRLVEEVVRSWMFSARHDEHGRLIVIGDADHDKVDWESGTNLRFECIACFGQFAIPEGASVDFE
jgi:hypothetical protein